MPSAQIIATWLEGDRAFVAARIDADSTTDDGKPCAVEYLTSIPADDLAGLSAAQRRALFAKAVRSERARSLTERAAGRIDLGLAGTLAI